MAYNTDPILLYLFIQHRSRQSGVQKHPCGVQHYRYQVILAGGEAKFVNGAEFVIDNASIVRS